MVQNGRYYRSSWSSLDDTPPPIMVQFGTQCLIMVQFWTTMPYYGPNWNTIPLMVQFSVDMTLMDPELEHNCPHHAMSDLKVYAGL
jgi:hypothetical protein